MHSQSPLAVEATTNRQVRQNGLQLQLQLQLQVSLCWGWRCKCVSCSPVGLNWGKAGGKVKRENVRHESNEHTNRHTWRDVSVNKSFDGLQWTLIEFAKTCAYAWVGANTWLIIEDTNTPIHIHIYKHKLINILLTSSKCYSVHPPCKRAVNCTTSYR